MSDSSGALRKTEVLSPASPVTFFERPQQTKVALRLINTAKVSSPSFGVPSSGVVEGILFRPESSLKRGFDLLVASLLFVVSLPIMGLVAIAVRLSSPGPIVLKQIRLTKGGRAFPMFKFRTMRADAESSTGAILARAGDSRVTAVGRILRCTRLDELPQLVNVLRGEMSLIGPRPERPEIAAQLRKELPGFDRRLEVKAGLTGLAQVKMGYSGCTESYRRKIALDRVYVRHQTLLLDLWIAVRTIGVMITGHGAR